MRSLIPLCGAIALLTTGRRSLGPGGHARPGLARCPRSILGDHLRRRRYRARSD